MSRILVVDDEPSIREFLYAILSDAGLAVATAANGDEALDVPGPFDLLLTDVMMPRMRGEELARRMRLRDPDLPVLYLTAYSDHLFEAKGALWNGEAFLEKPVTGDGLLEAIYLLLEERNGWLGADAIGHDAEKLSANWRDDVPK